MLANSLVVQREVVARYTVTRVGLHPLFVDLDGLLHLPSDKIVVMRRDIEPFALAGSFFQVERLCDKTRGQVSLGEVAVGHTQRGMRHGEVRIELDGAFEVGNGLRIFKSLVLCLPKAES